MIAGLSANRATMEFGTEVCSLYAFTAAVQISIFSSDTSKTSTSFRIAEVWETSSTASTSPVSSYDASPSFHLGLAPFWY